MTVLQTWSGCQGVMTVAKLALCLRLGKRGDRVGDANAARPRSHLTRIQPSLVHVGLLWIVRVFQVEPKSQADRRNEEGHAITPI